MNISGLKALEHVAAIRAASREWTDETYKQLTNFMLGRPVRKGYRFQVIAGAPIVQVAPSTAHETVSERFESRRAKKAAKQQRWRLNRALHSA